MLSLLNIDYSSLMGTLPLNSGSSDSLNSFINNGFLGLITEADTTYKIVGSVIALVFALLGCFFGYKLSKVFMSITGFIIGLFIGQIAASQLLHVEGFASVLCIILGGAVIAALALWIYRIGIFILCFTFAFSAAGTLFSFEGDIQFFINIIAGLIVGVLAVKYASGYYPYFRNRMRFFRCRASSRCCRIYGNYKVFFHKLKCNVNTCALHFRNSCAVSHNKRPCTKKSFQT